MTTYDLEEARRLRDEAIERVARNRDAWLRLGFAAGVQIAKQRTELCSFHVRLLLVAWKVWPPPEPRLMGPLMQRLRGAGVIEPTERRQQSPFTSQHAYPCRVWRSLYNLTQGTFPF